MIDIYFVRHGRTDGNNAKRHQAEHSRLTQEGKEQVAKAAVWAQGLQPTHLLASRHVRALQTAQIIGEAVNMIPQGEDVFIELKRPDSVYGHRHRSVRSMWYLIRWYLGYAGDHGEDGKGESYETFRARLDDAQKFLKELPDGSRAIVISHAVFIGFMARHLCDKDPVALPDAISLFRNVLSLHNAGYTHVQYNPDASEGTCPWQLVSHDNHAHLEG